jgi:hypothetical protein
MRFLKFSQRWYFLKLASTPSVKSRLDIHRDGFFLFKFLLKSILNHQFPRSNYFIVRCHFEQINTYGQ